MNHFTVVNFHITNHCNYHCTYCFGKFEKQQDPPLNDAKKVVENIGSYFRQSQINDGRINLAGGEPLLYPHLNELIDCIRSHGVAVSIVTNASLLTVERVAKWQGKVSCIGISVDSLDNDTNRKIGRCCGQTVTDLAHLRTLSVAMQEHGIDLKINTVVSRLNLGEDLTPLYRALRPKKIKLLQMHLIRGVNDKAGPYQITDDEFNCFCSRHAEFRSIIVEEPCGSMENSYLMVNPNGEFQLNDNGIYRKYGDLKAMPLGKILENVPMCAEKFNSRYEKGDPA